MDERMDLWVDGEHPDGALLHGLIREMSEIPGA